ncbi:MAG: DUF898 family protein, partial [Candidatus Rokuibacteriota bacterium]
MVDGQEPAGRPSFFRKPVPPGSGAPRPVAPRSPAAPATPPPPVPPPPSPPESVPAPPSGPGPDAPGSTALRRPSFHGTGGTLFGIHIVNTLLTLVTLGFYYFWAKTRL